MLSITAATDNKITCNHKEHWNEIKILHVGKTFCYSNTLKEKILCQLPFYYNIRFTYGTDQVKLN